MPYRPDGRAARVAWSLVSLAVLLRLIPATGAEEPGPDEVATLLVEKCLSCHAADAKKGGLDLSRREAAEQGLVPPVTPRYQDR